MATNVKKKSSAEVFTKKGTNYSYQYTDLATIHEELERQGITYRQYTDYDEKAQADYIYTALKYGDDEEKQPQRGARIIDGNTLAGGNAAQEYGSALTYARRYSLLMALGWATEDDDAASVSHARTKPAQTAQHSLDGRLDFEKVKSYLKTLTTVEEVESAKAKTFEKYPKISDKQKSALNRIFADRCDQITEGEPKNWHDAEDVVPTEEELRQANL